MTTNTPQNVVRICDKDYGQLYKLHAIDGLTFRQIALRGYFSPCPAGTLATIFHTRNVPDKWRAVFGLPLLALAPVCPRCGVVHVKRCNPRPAQRWDRMSVKAVRDAIINREVMV